MALGELSDISGIQIQHLQCISLGQTGEECEQSRDPERREVQRRIAVQASNKVARTSWDFRPS
jgi:hypothetical protein